MRVVPGGCSGFQYSLNIEEQSREGDFILDEKGVRMFVDMFSAQYLNGVEIDYVSGDDGFRLHIQESQRHRQLRMRLFVYRLNIYRDEIRTGDGSNPVSLFRLNSSCRILQFLQSCSPQNIKHK